MCFPTIQQSLYLKLIQQQSEGKTENCQALTAGFNTDVLEQKYCGHTTTIWCYSGAFHREFIRTSSRPQPCKPQSCWMLVLFTASFMSRHGTTFPEAQWRGERSVLGRWVIADQLTDINRWEGRISPPLMRTFSHMDVEELSAKSSRREISAITIASEWWESCIVLKAFECPHTLVKGHSQQSLLHWNN